MNPASFALRKRTVMVVFTVMLIGAGILSYKLLGRLEDPTFTIKTALVVTPYPGASSLEVEEEVTDKVEEAIQQLGQLKEIRSISQEGRSVIFVDIKDEYKSYQLPQIWDELRRKVGAAQMRLPPGAGPCIVNDDFGDVYGVFFAITGDGYSYADLKTYADDLKRELLLCDDVARIQLWGVRQEVIYVEMDRAKMAELGLSPQAIFGTLHAQNLVTQSGKTRMGEEYVRITPTGDFTSEEMIGDLIIGGPDSLVRLRDVATIRRGYSEPPANLMHYNGQPAIGLGISTVDGGNVIVMGESIKKRLKALESTQPLGMELHAINYQSENVAESVHIFVINLVEAVVIVIVLLMLFMGWQSGLLIGAILILTILGTFIVMWLTAIDLQKISLGALIVALGMLVDNAIVVADGILVRVEKGESREEAAQDVVRDTQWPLFGATLVAILAFAAIGFAPGNVGEFCRSLFYVLAISLGLSWILAVTITPLFCVWFLRIPDVHDVDPYDRPMFRVYRRFLHLALRVRWLTLLVALMIMWVSLYGFRFVDQYFFPDSTRRQFYVDYWRFEGSRIEQTAADVTQVESYIAGLEGVRSTSTFIGEGALRFILPYNYESPNTSYAQVLVDVDDYRRIPKLIHDIQQHLDQTLTEAEARVHRFANGPPVNYRIETRLRGPDIDELRRLAKQAKDIMRQEDVVNLRDDWRTPVKTIRPVFSEAQARRTGITRDALSQALQWTYNGIRVGLYREGDELLPILARAPANERRSPESMLDVQIWSPLLHKSIPLRQVVTKVETRWEPPLIHRRNRQRVMTVQCNPRAGLADPLFQRLRPKIEAISLPAGYSLEWGGEYEQSEKGRAPLRKAFPICLLGMFLIIVWLFNSIRRPLIIFLCVPLAIIGVTGGLLLFHIPFGFMAILGFLGLSGMLIKNAVVLIDQIALDLNAGKAPYQAVLDAAVSRMRPVLMASGTTILGMAPLIVDPFYSGMAATIMSGLLVGTFLTLVMVPMFYCMFFRIKSDPSCV
jgi:multidrug efflux pump subunit AcrB